MEKEDKSVTPPISLDGLFSRESWFHIWEAFCNYWNKKERFWCW